jgi:hypothetical protein
MLILTIGRNMSKHCGGKSESRKGAKMEDYNYDPWYIHGPEELTEAINEVTKKHIKALHEELSEIEGINPDDLQISVQVDLIDQEELERWEEHVEEVKEQIDRYVEWRQTFDPNMN